MDIIIAGAGNVGFKLAQTLSIGHNVIVIDINKEALQTLQESLDILPIEGDIENPDTYKKLIEKEVDLFIAVTNFDEANIISTIIANDIIKIKRKFIRLKNDFFAKTTIKEKIGIDKTIFPLHITSETIETLLHYPKANNVKAFKYTDLKLISIRVSEDIEARVFQHSSIVIVGIERGKDFLIPQKNSMIYPNDLIYFFGNDEDIQETATLLDTKTPLTIQKCVVFGADSLGVIIAQTLIKNGITVKLIEKDSDLCQKAEEELEGKAVVINARYSTDTLYEDEGLKHADMLVMATTNDEYNIIKSIEAKEHGVNKVVVINNEMEYYNIMHSLGLVVVRGPKISAYNAILENIDNHGVVSERRYCGGKGTMYMHKVFTGSKHISKKIKAPKQINNCRTFLVRDEKIIEFDKAISLLEEDKIISFSASDVAQKSKVWIYGF